MEFLLLTDRGVVAVPESSPTGISATALSRAPLPRTREHDSVGCGADLRVPLLGSA
jgi:hypothetical protein